VIARLSGRLDAIAPEGVVIDVGGVGYQVFCSARTQRLLPMPGEAARLFVETHVREDHIHLYGFVDEAERGWFRLLTTVQGVGAKTALAILSVLTPEGLHRAILVQDKASLAQADGVGQKLAQRIVIELKDKAGGAALAQIVPAIAAVAAGAEADAVSALVNLGYKRPEAQGAVGAASRQLGDAATLDTLIRTGLKELAR
jgi:Holliday junction DNA helicase RuvA